MIVFFFWVLAICWSGYILSAADENIFVPFEINESNNTPLHDVDPDLQLYVSQCSPSANGFDYYIEKNFNKKITQMNTKQGCFCDTFEYTHYFWKSWKMSWKSWKNLEKCS